MTAAAWRRLRGRHAPDRDAPPTGPGAEAAHPRNNDRLLFDGIPWVARAQDEHDAFAEALRDRDVEVLYLTDLLTETFADEDVRAEAIETALLRARTSATPCAATCARC